MPEMPMSGVRSQLLPLHGELSTRSLAPAASTAGWFASMASPGSFEPLGRYGVLGLPTVTLLSADTALAGVETARAASSENATGMPKRRAVIGFLPRGDRPKHTVREQDEPRDFGVNAAATGTPSSADASDRSGRTSAGILIVWLAASPSRRSFRPLCMVLRPTNRRLSTSMVAAGTSGAPKFSSHARPEDVWLGLMDSGSTK